MHFVCKIQNKLNLLFIIFHHFWLTRKLFVVYNMKKCLFFLTKKFIKVIVVWIILTFVFQSCAAKKKEAKNIVFLYSTATIKMFKFASFLYLKILSY